MLGNEKKIVNGGDIARRDGMGSYREWLKRAAFRFGHRFRDEVDEEAVPVHAFMDYGRWVARCPVCGGAEYIDPDDPVFFCLSCGNAAIGGRLRKVKMPRHWRLAERAALSRPIPGRHFAGGE